MITDEQQHRLISTWIEHANKTRGRNGQVIPLVYCGHFWDTQGITLQFYIMQPRLRRPYQTHFIAWDNVITEAQVYGFHDIVKALR